MQNHSFQCNCFNLDSSINRWTDIAEFVSHRDFLWEMRFSRYICELEDLCVTHNGLSCVKQCYIPPKTNHDRENAINWAFAVKLTIYFRWVNSFYNLQLFMKLAKSIRMSTIQLESHQIPEVNCEKGEKVNGKIIFYSSFCFAYIWIHLEECDSLDLRDKSLLSRHNWDVSLVNCEEKNDKNNLSFMITMSKAIIFGFISSVIYVSAFSFFLSNVFSFFVLLIFHYLMNFSSCLNLVIPWADLIIHKTMQIKLDENDFLAQLLINSKEFTLFKLLCH